MFRHTPAAHSHTHITAIWLYFSVMWSVARWHLFISEIISFCPPHDFLLIFLGSVTMLRYLCEYLKTISTEIGWRSWSTLFYRCTPPTFWDWKLPCPLNLNVIACRIHVGAPKQILFPRYQTVPFDSSIWTSVTALEPPCSQPYLLCTGPTKWTSYHKIHAPADSLYFLRSSSPIHLPFWNKGKQAASGERLAMSMNYCSSQFFIFFSSTLRVLSPILFRWTRGEALEVRGGVISEKGSNMRSKTQKALEDKTQAFRLRNTCVRLYDHEAMVAIRLSKFTKYVVNIKRPSSRRPIYQVPRLLCALPKT